MLVKTLLTALLAAAAAPLALGLDIHGRIELPQNATVPASSRVKLNHGSTPGAWVRPDGSFTIEGVPKGAYVLTPIVHGYTVAHVLLSVIPDRSPDTPTEEIVHVQPWQPSKLPSDPYTSPSLPYPFILYGRADDYFVPAPGVNVLALFKSPMVLMMLFSGVMMYLMPKMQESMANMDPDAMKDMAEAQKRMQAGDWKGGFSNMLGAAEASPASGGASNGNGKQKRKGK